MLRIGSVVMGVSDVRRAAAFWMEALGYRPRDEIEDTWVVLVPRRGHAEGPRLSLALSDTPLQEHPRVHLDLYAANTADQAAEVDRLVSIGAERVDWDLYPQNADFIVLADPDGNRFCVIDTSHGQTTSGTDDAGRP
ncbi:MAG TPA: VOC family protein [Actinocrinis sp.]|uniref:VOC family protein n=1 Tax=Actinocrinis sp. TaxID=1920516 RepID=UPI002DDD8E30|nr:VOC family protein [Actinocrinis sp.]HEV2345437.1 VOC family protein [Actinocrinis sp.]